MDSLKPSKTLNNTLKWEFHENKHSRATQALNCPQDLIYAGIKFRSINTKYLIVLRGK